MGFWESCGCGAGDDDVKEKSKTKPNKSKKTSAVTSQIAPTLDLHGSPGTTTIEVHTIYYWSGFRKSGEEVNVKKLQINIPHQITQVTGTDNEIIFLLEDGSLWSYCKNSDLPETISPVRHDFPKGVVIISVSSGKYHSLALDSNGTMYSWGSNKFGQVGQGLRTDECDSIENPRLIKSMAYEVVVQVAAGEKHSVALTQTGDIYTCGSNMEKQVGGIDAELVTIFVKVDLPSGLPWNSIAAGGNSTMGFTTHGQILGWGDNSKGQLDKEEKKPLPPTELGVYKNSCFVLGKYHVLVWNKDKLDLGAFGGNRYNQQGPIFDEGKVTQIACGEYHSLVVGDGKLYCYGPEENDKDEDIPREGDHQKDPVPIELPEIRDFRIFAFGTTSFVVPTTEVNPLQPTPTPRRILQLTEELLEIFKTLVETEIVEPGLEKRFVNLLQTAVWNGSFPRRRNSKGELDLPSNVTTPFEDPLAYYFGHCIDFLQAEKFIKSLCSLKSQHLQKLLRQQLTQWLDDTTTDFLYGHNCPIVAFLPLIILNLPRPRANLQPEAPTFQSIFQQMLNVLSPLPDVSRGPSPAGSPATSRRGSNDNINQEGQSHDEQEFLLDFASLFLHKEVSKIGESVKICRLIYHCYSQKQLERLIVAYKKVIVGTLLKQKDNGKSLQGALKIIIPALVFLRSLWITNKIHKRLSHYTFTIPQINKLVDIRTDFATWVQKKAVPLLSPKGLVYMCDFPFVFDSSAKAILLEAEQKLQMFGVTIWSRILEPLEMQEFKLAVRRDNLLQDVLRQIPLFNAFDFKKPLRIEFIGEEGQDAGGVRKEFFLLLIRQLLDFCSERGLIFYNDESHFAWFNNGLEEEAVFFMGFGVLCALAIYNNTIIKLPFPSAFYKKILKKACELEDLIEFSPTEGRSLKQLLDYTDPNLEETFGLTFQINRLVLGEQETIELKPGGESLAVTQENKREFVELYIDSFFNKKAQTSFQNFERGFNLVFQDSLVLGFFSPEELQEIIIGNEDYDWGSLEEECKYEGIYYPGHKTIKEFWEVFHQLETELKKKFLLFLTGSDRVPIQGMSAIKIIINPAGEDDSYLPVAHTCFNALDLPVYKNQEILKGKLLMAIEHVEGFTIA